MIDLTVCQSARGYFIPRSYGIVYIVHVYLHFLCDFFSFWFYVYLMFLFLIEIIFKQIYLTLRWHSDKYYFSVRVDLGVMKMKG